MYLCIDTLVSFVPDISPSLPPSHAHTHTHNRNFYSECLFLVCLSKFKGKYNIWIWDANWWCSSNFNLYSLLSQLRCIIAHTIIVTIVWYLIFAMQMMCNFGIFKNVSVLLLFFFLFSFSLSWLLVRALISVQRKSIRLRNDICLNGLEYSCVLFVAWECQSVSGHVCHGKLWKASENNIEFNVMYVHKHIYWSEPKYNWKWHTESTRSTIVYCTEGWQKKTGRMY